MGMDGRGDLKRFETKKELEDAGYKEITDAEADVLEKIQPGQKRILALSAMRTPAKETKISYEKNTRKSTSADKWQKQCWRKSHKKEHRRRLRQARKNRATGKAG